MKGDVVGVVLLAACIVLLAFVYPMALDELTQRSGRESNLSAYSNGWNDVSMFRKALEDEGFETHGVVATAGILKEVEEPERTLLVIVGVETRYSYRDTLAIEGFIDAGGSMIIADDGGYADDLAREFDVSFYRYDMWDPNFIHNTSFLNITVTLPDEAGDPKPYEVLLNRPTALDSKDQGTPLGMTTDESYLDSSKPYNYIDTGDIRGPFEVVTLKGRMVFIGDSSIFINDMWDKLDNADFSVSLVEFLLPEGGVVLFDESTHLPSDLSEGFYRTIAATFVFVFGDLWTGLFVTAGITTMLVVASTVVRDPRLWHHRLGIRERTSGNLTFMESNFKGKGQDLKDRLRSNAYDLISVRSGMRPDEFAAISDKRLQTLVADDRLYEFLKGGDLSPEEIFERLGRWL